MSTHRFAGTDGDPKIHLLSGESLRIVVCGDSSAGKSAVAALLTGASGLLRELGVVDAVGDESVTESLICETSAAACAVLVVDARTGVGAHARRYSQLAALLGVRKLVLAVNKIDLVADAEMRFAEIAAGFDEFASGIVVEVECVPISAAGAENVLHRSANLSWYQGPTLIGALERVSGERLPRAAAPVPTDRRANGGTAPGVADQLRVMVIWLAKEPMLRGRSYLAQIGAHTVRATVAPIKYRLNADTHEHVPATKLERDEVGACDLELSAAVEFDPYRDNHVTGVVRLIDPINGATMGVGLIQFALRRSQNLHWQALNVARGHREVLLQQQATVLWFTGLSGAGKSTVANQLEIILHGRGHLTYVLDGDNVRHGLNADLGFTDADRAENVRRVAQVARLMVDAGLIVIVAFISPFRAEREMARSLFNVGEFLEIHVDAPLAVVEERDPKGLYKKARRGELVNFTGLDSPYEQPERPDMRIDTTLTSPDVAARAIVQMLDKNGRLRKPMPS
jgi:bifunctional enzyme CysN/CysC